MRGAARQRPAPAIVAGLLALAPLGVCAATPAARVEFASGHVTAVDLQGAQRPLRKGDTVGEGDTVNTNSGRAQLRFTDGSFVALQPDSLFRIDRYRFDGKPTGEERGFFALLKGGMRTITGLVGRTDKRNYKVETALATIGIRGTEYAIQYGNSVSGTVGEGEISACNAGGCLNVASGQSFLVIDPQTTPVLTTVRTSLPPPQPEIQADRSRVTASGDEATPNGAPRSLAEAQPTGGGARSPTPTGAGAGNGNGGGNQGDNPNSGGGSFPTVGQLTSGDNWMLAYARNGGTPQVEVVAPGESASSAQFEDNMLMGFRGPGQRDFSQAEGVADGGASGTIIGWGRWLSAYKENGETVQLGPNQGFHYVVGQPAPANVLNGGTGTYTLIGGTAPTGSDGGAPGKLNAATLFADFGARRVAAEFNLSYGGRTYDVSTPGGATALGAAQAGMDLNRGLATFRGTAFNLSGCAAAGCSAAVQGFFAGPAAERAGLAYAIIDGAGAVEGPAPLTITGAAALAAQPPAVTGKLPQ